METEKNSILKRVGAAATGILLFVIIVFVFAAPKPQQQQYPERTPVRFWHMWTGEWKTVVERICNDYNKSQTKYEVVPLSVPGSAADSKFLLAVAGGNPPDVMAQWNPVIPSWAESKLLIPLDDLMTPAQWKDFQENAYPIARKIGIYKGRLYGVTTGTNVRALYYRPDHLRAAGLDPNHFPETLEELMEWGHKLNKFDADHNLIRIGYMPAWFMQFAPVFGGGFYDYEKGELALNTPANLRALEFLVAERKRLGYENVVRFESGQQAGNGGGQWGFISGFYSITENGQWRVEELRKYASDLEYATAPIPPPAGGKKNAGFANGNFLIIPKGAKNVEGAWDFIKFWSGLEKPERAAKFYTWGGWLPINPAVANAPVYREYVRKNPQFKTFLDMMPSENLLPDAPVPYQNYLADRIARADDSATRGTVTPLQALKTLEKDIRDEQARRKEFRYDD